MVSKQIRHGLWHICAREPERRGFGQVSYTDSGVMYNAYLMDTGDGFAALGSLPERYTADWVSELQSLAGKDLKWAVFFGTDNDRAAAQALLEEFPEVTVIGGKNGLFQLRSCIEAGFHGIEVRSGRTLSLGEKTIQFHVLQEKFAISGVYAVEEKDGLLLTADAFGSVMAAQASLVSELKEKSAYFAGVDRYFRDIFGEKRTKSIAEAVALVQEKGIGMICPAQGPVVDAELDALLKRYQQPKREKTGKPTLAIVYAPGGYVREVAKIIEAGVRDSGDVQVVSIDLDAMNRMAALDAIADADAYLFGTPDVRDDAAKGIWDIVTSLSAEDCQGKPAAILCSATVLGKAAQNLQQRLAQLGCDLNLKDCVIQGVPDKQILDNAYEYGFNTGCYLQKIPNPHKPTLVKCLVCGEIFDASLGTCPVCGVGLDQCVPVDADKAGFKKNTKSTYLILGGGIAAVSAAEAIRLRDETGSIVILSAENYLPVNRPMLTKNLERIDSDPSSIQVHNQTWYDERGVVLHLGVSAVTLHPETKNVTASDGAVYSYDKLIYATGAECFVPPFPGHDKPGVLTIRHLWDSAELQKRIDGGAKNAVVIGGGVLGLEAASELMRSGLKVTVLEATPQIVGRQIDAQSAAILKSAMEKLGVVCHEGVSIAGILGEKQATGVALTDGREFPADFVIVSCGNRGNVGPAKAAGVAVDRAIVVNERMETNLPDIYACGDCAQFDGVNFQLWQEASSQGRVAGANAAGERLTYANQLLGLSLEGFGTTLYAMGDPGKKPEVRYQTVETRDGVTGRQETYWFFGGKLEGAVVIGAPEKTAQVSEAVTTHARYTELF